MRARAGDPPRTMAQKILAGRAADPTLAADLVEVKVDQIVLARAPMRAFAEALSAGLKKTTAEVAIAYDGACVTEAASSPDEAGSPRAVSADMLGHGLIVARAGVGYPSAVHLERFASPARLCVTDEPRLAGVGGDRDALARRADGAARAGAGAGRRVAAAAAERPGAPERPNAPVRVRARRRARAHAPRPGRRRAARRGGARGAGGARVRRAERAASCRWASAAVLSALAPQLGAAAPSS